MGEMFTGVFNIQGLAGDSCVGLIECPEPKEHSGLGTNNHSGLVIQDMSFYLLGDFRPAAEGIPTTTSNTG